MRRGLIAAVAVGSAVVVGATLALRRHAPDRAAPAPGADPRGQADGGTPAAAVRRWEGVRSLEGMVTWATGSAVFILCPRGDAFPVSKSGAYAQLERAYGDASAGSGASLLVYLRGSITAGPGPAGGPGVDSLVVHAVEGSRPGGGCGEAVADLPLEGTEWVLTELDGAPLPAGVEATLLLDGGEGEARGSGGCGRFRGPYRLEGGRITFGDLIPTRAACPGPASAVEGAYLRTLARAGGYRILGDGLELLAEEGTVARFRSR